MGNKFENFIKKALDSMKGVTYSDEAKKRTSKFLNMGKTMMLRFLHYFRIWLLMSRNSFMIMLSEKVLFVLFLSGKVIRFLFFFAFIFFLVTGANTLAGYSVNQTIFFFLTFNVVDVIAQFFFREVYRFRPLVVSGDLDLVMAKPMNPLFRVLLGGADVIDLATIPPLIFATIYIGAKLGPQIHEIVLYLFLLLNGFLIATAFHISVLALGIITLEIDHTIMIYRDLTNLGRLPVDIYKEPLRSIITYLIPVGVMITLPAKAFMGLVSFSGVAISFLLAASALYFSLRFWRYALKAYTSASS